jgi:protein SCO1/2
MRLWPTIANTLLGGLLVLFNTTAAEFSLPSDTTETNAQIFAAKGVVEELKPDSRTVVIRHEAISNYMAAMAMPFKVKAPGELAGVRAGDEISFQLHVTDTESWIDQIVKIGTAPPEGNRKPTAADTVPVVRPSSPLLDYKFTNELGQAVSLNDFHGQALAITFFYTRCPLPEYCPRLSKNFQEASQKLKTMPGAPANWHFLSISFDTEFDSPAMLKAYGESYQYDPKHWSFLTGPPDKIAGLARGSGVMYESDDGTINHNFRTLIIDAAGHLQTVFPTGGNLSDQIAAEIIKAAAVTNQPLAQNQSR